MNLKTKLLWMAALISCYLTCDYSHDLLQFITGKYRRWHGQLIQGTCNTELRVGAPVPPSSLPKGTTSRLQMKKAGVEAVPSLGTHPEKAIVHTDDVTGAAKSSMSDEQERRKARIRDVCAVLKSRPTPPSRMPFVLADRRHHVIYSEIPKVGSTSWLYLLINLTGKVKVNFEHREKNHFGITDPNFLKRIGLSYLPSLHAPEAMRMLNNYYRFVFVRHPFSRILAAYRDKLNPGNGVYHQKYGLEILSLFRNNTSQDDRLAGRGTTFSEFVKYIIYLWKTRRPFDEHWRTLYDLSFPCTIEYDFIGKLETQDRDAAIVMRDGFKLNQSVPFPKETSYHKTGSKGSSAVRAYKDIPKEHKDILREIYKYDFELFGYSKNIY